MKTEYILANTQTLETLCILQPTKIIMNEGLVTLVQPCGHKHQKGTPVYCQRFQDGSCEYLGREYKLKIAKEKENKIPYTNETK